jgi:hypothetical protein
MILKLVLESRQGLGSKEHDNCSLRVDVVYLLIETHMEANREYKNSVFSTLFGNEAALRELYSAIEGVELPPDVPIVINTLDNACHSA